jgi:D-alanyl-D-alanine carboxypeptidase
MDPWLKAALDYLPRWLEFQMRQTEQPGLSLAVVHQGKPVLTAAFGHADQPGGVALTPQHRFRVASHSKTFTAAALMKLRERGRLQLDDPDRPPRERPAPRRGRGDAGAAAVAQRRPDARRARLGPVGRAPAVPRRGRGARRPGRRHDDRRQHALQVLEPRLRPARPGHRRPSPARPTGTGSRARSWPRRAWHDTLPDVPPKVPPALNLASGHSSKWPVGRRLVIPATMDTHALSGRHRLRQHRQRPGALLRQPVAAGQARACCRSPAGAR